MPSWTMCRQAANSWALRPTAASPTTRATSWTKFRPQRAGWTYAHYSVAILDALRLCGVPAVEVMLHAPDEREPFRKTDVVSFGCQGHFIGEGPQGYLHACIYLAQLLRTDGSSKAHIVM